MFAGSFFSGREGGKHTPLAILIFLLTILILLLTIGTAGAAKGEMIRHSASDPDLNFNVLMGTRTLSDPSWKEENEFLAGFDIDLKSTSLPLNWFLGLHSSRATKLVSNGGTVERAYVINEFNIGARKYMKITYRTRVYGGGGVAVVNADGSYISAEPPFDVISEREYGVGYYMNGGGDLRLGKSFHIGADIKISGGTELSGGTDVNDVDNSLYFGWGF